VDGATRLSLKTSKKGLAEHRLEEYIKGKYGLKPTPTVGEFYSRWIQTKVEPLCRRALVKDYRIHFSAYILPAFKHIRLAAMSTKDLNDFRVKCLRRGLAVKTVRNIIDASFRACIGTPELKLKCSKAKTRSLIFNGRDYRERSQIRSQLRNEPDSCVVAGQ
jgi:hypothetical protein